MGETVMEWVQVPKQVTVEVPVQTEEIVSEQVAYEVPYTETIQVPVQTEDIIDEQVAYSVPYTETISVPVQTQDIVHGQVAYEVPYTETISVPVTTEDVVYEQVAYQVQQAPIAEVTQYQEVVQQIPMGTYQQSYTQPVQSYGGATNYGSYGGYTSNYGSSYGGL